MFSFGCYTVQNINTLVQNKRRRAHSVSEPLRRDWSSILKQTDKCAAINVEIVGDDGCAVAVFGLSINTVAATLYSYNNKPITDGQNYSTV